MLPHAKWSGVTRFAMCLLATTSLAACGSDSDDNSHDMHGGAGMGSEGHELTVGLTRMGESEAVVLELLDFEPTTTIKGDNSWTVALTDAASGEAYEPASLSAEPWMPAHNHGARIEPTVTPGDEPGTYILEPLRFHMAGRWVVRLYLCSEAEERCERGSRSLVDRIELDVVVPD